jgi:hypothetical protein
MNNFYKKIELFANIAIILVAISLVVVLGKRFVFTRPAPSPPPDSQQLVGQKFALPDVDWSRSNKTLVLVLSDKCHFCTDSAPFYQRVVRERAQRESFRLTAVFPQAVSDGRRYLDGLGVAIEEIRQASPDSIGVRGTPTLLIVNNAGVVTDSWIGKLPPETEAEVLSRLQ